MVGELGFEEAFLWKRSIQAGVSVPYIYQLMPTLPCRVVFSPLILTDGITNEYSNK